MQFNKSAFKADMKDLRNKILSIDVNSFMESLTKWIPAVFIAIGYDVKVFIGDWPGFSFALTMLSMLALAGFWRIALEAIFGQKEEIKKMQIKVDTGIRTLILVKNASPQGGKLYSACARAIELMEDKK